MLDREEVSLDTFCADVDDTCFHSSMASSARLVVLAYFRLLEQINSPPFVDPELQRLGREGGASRAGGSQSACTAPAVGAQALCARRSAWSIAAPGAVIFPVADATDGQPSARINASSSRITLAGASGP